MTRLQEIVGTKELKIIPLGNAGYVIHKTKVPLIAEAPWVMMDFDDTAAQTTRDKSRCREGLVALGIPDEAVAYCDKLARVLLPEDTSPMYEPELEMRLLSVVSGHAKKGPVVFNDKLMQELQQERAVLLKDKSLREHPVDPDIVQLYQDTRFRATLYPDTIETVKKLRGHPERPCNTAIFTYGDPTYQLERAMELFEKGEMNQLWLTRKRKGEFFRELIRTNPFRNLPLNYTYPETERGIGINFRNWNILVALFDDDSKQAESFNRIAREEGLSGMMAVVRVRRAGVKRAGLETPAGEMVMEISPSDTYLDTDLYLNAMKELETRILEKCLADAVQIEGADILSDQNILPIVETVARDRGMTPDVLRQLLLGRLS